LRGIIQRSLWTTKVLIPNLVNGVKIENPLLS
jgi:hypothetical protein